MTVGQVLLQRDQLQICIFVRSCQLTDHALKRFGDAEMCATDMFFLCYFGSRFAQARSLSHFSGFLRSVQLHRNGRPSDAHN